MNRYTIYLIVFIMAATMPTQAQEVLFPAQNAKNVNIDTHLVLHFTDSPTIGEKGCIKVYEEGSNRLVDCLDLSIPAGPTEKRKNPKATYTPIPYEYKATNHTNANTKPGTPSGCNQPENTPYQLTIIGHFTDGFHFYPIIIHDKTATIYLHHNLLEYGKNYYVTIDEGVLSAKGFKGFTQNNPWKFSTKKHPSVIGNKIAVSPDGSADFNTVQGALDYIPDFTPHSLEQKEEDTDLNGGWHIYIKNGDYEEIVYFRNKRHVTIEGESKEGVVIHYPNCEIFNPHPELIKTNENIGTFPSRRASFMCDNGYAITLMNLTLRTDCKGQAEALLIMGVNNSVYNVIIDGSGDALQVNGPTYFERCDIIGDGDTVMGRGPAFFRDCSITSSSYMTRARGTEKNHGYVFNHCTFNGIGDNAILTRTPVTDIYPAAEVILLNCTLNNVNPLGWNALEGDTSKARLWEYNSRNTNGTPIDVSKRHPVSRQLDKEKDAEWIEKYQNPFYILR